MKRVSRLIAMSLTAVALSFGADTFTGNLTDTMCKGKDQATHTAKCAIGCAKSGYGLVTADGTFLKFDKEGDAKALAALKATSKENDLKAKVTGTREGDTLKVDSVEIM
jgi:hypothetical protein